MSFHPFSSEWVPPPDQISSTIELHHPTHATPPDRQSEWPTPPDSNRIADDENKRPPMSRGGFSERYRSWSSGTSASLNPPKYTAESQQRLPLGNLNTNVSLGSPFFSSDPNRVWGPPQPLQTISGIRGTETSLADQLMAAQRRIQELTIENQQLRQFQTTSRSGQLVSPALSAHSSGFLEHPLRPSPINPFGMLGLLDDNDAFTAASSVADPSFIPPPHMVNAILHGTFNFTDMAPEYTRPIVWVIAHCQPRSNAESAGLKTAVNALATRFAYPRDSDHAVILIEAILEWAKDLCFTSCGNYLCQQLLERGDVDDKLTFIDKIRADLVAIASDKFGTHVLCKAVSVRELENPIADALLKHGIFDSLKTGARRLWREYMEKCRQAQSLEIFEKINTEMSGRWADLACINEHGSIAVQQVFEVFGTPELMILESIAQVANNQYGHFVVTKLIGYPPLYRPTCDAILTSYPPVATTHHGVNFSKIALTEGGRASISKYLDAICSQENGRTPGIVAIATSSIGKAHLTFVLSCLTPAEHARIRQVCRAYSTTLRNSQSGNDLLRALGLINAIGSRHRSAGV